MAAVTANIDVIRDDQLVDRANAVGSVISDGLRALQADGLIEHYEGVGALWAADIGRDSLAVRNRMIERGVIMRPIGNRLAMCPPLVITDDEIGRMLDTMQQTLAEA